MFCSARNPGLRAFSTMVKNYHPLPVHNYQPSISNCAKELLQQKLNEMDSSSRYRKSDKKKAAIFINYPIAKKMSEEMLEICNKDHPFDLDLQKKMNEIYNVWKGQINFYKNQSSTLYKGHEHLIRKEKTNFVERAEKIIDSHRAFLSLIETDKEASDIFNDNLPYFPIKNQVIPQLDRNLLKEITFDILYSECNEKMFSLFIKHKSQNDPEVNLSFVSEKGKNFLSGGKVDVVPVRSLEAPYDRDYNYNKAWVIGQFPEGKKSDIFEWSLPGEYKDREKVIHPSENLLINFDSEQKISTPKRFFPTEQKPTPNWPHDAHLVNGYDTQLKLYEDNSNVLDRIENSRSH